jgi:hypothetical protein
MFSDNLRSFSDETMCIRTGTIQELSSDGYEDDISITFNLATGKVSPNTYEDEIPFYYQFWGALRSMLEKYDSEDRFIINMEDSDSTCVHCGWDDYDEEPHPLTGTISGQMALQIFKEAVKLLTN